MREGATRCECNVARIQRPSRVVIWGHENVSKTKTLSTRAATTFYIVSVVHFSVDSTKALGK